MTAAAIIGLLLSRPPCYIERNDPDRVAHVTLQAEAIAAVAATAEEAAALASIGDHEGRWCWDVATGKRKGGPGEGPWQLEPGSHRPRPYSGADVASLSHAASQALWLWRHSWQCGPSAAARFRAYAGLPCDSKWDGAAKRARFYYWALWQLKKAEAAGAQ